MTIQSRGMFAASPEYRTDVYYTTERQFHIDRRDSTPSVELILIGGFGP